jgi:hypothetical protein
MTTLVDAFHNDDVRKKKYSSKHCSIVALQKEPGDRKKRP